MAVTSVTSTTTTTSAATQAKKTATLNYDNFLKLFVAQLKNQDPTQPMDASEQMAQLATFSQVEQAVKTNSNLESLISQNRFTQAASLVGKTVTSSDGLTSGVVKSVNVASDGLTATLTTGKTLLMGNGVQISS